MWRGGSQIKAHVHAMYPDEGRGHWLRTTMDIDECAQSVWAQQSRSTRLALGREEEVKRLTSYCDAEDSMTPMLVSYSPVSYIPQFCIMLSTFCDAR